MLVGPDWSDGLVETIGHEHVLACHLVVHSGALVPHCDTEGCLHWVIVHVHESLDELDLLFGVDVEVEVVDEVIHISHKVVCTWEQFLRVVGELGTLVIVSDQRVPVMSLVVLRVVCSREAFVDAKERISRYCALELTWRS